MGDRECCGTCEHNCYEGGEFYCNNVDSDYYRCPTAYDDNCENYDKK